MTQAMLQRVVWNNQGWRRPSGVTTDAGYADVKGFGHEEWNFQTDDHCGGEVLGYVYYTPKENVLDAAGNSFDIGFFTIEASTKTRWLVGVWRNARFVDQDEVDVFHDHYERSGIYERRAVELTAAVPGLGLTAARKEVRRGLERGWVRLVASVSDVHAFEREEWVPLGKKIGVKGLGLHFTTPTFVDALPNGGGPRTQRIVGHTAAPSSEVPLVEDGYLREVGGGLVFIAKEHAALSNQLAAWLKRQKCTAIRQEENQVDVGFERHGEKYLAELKVCGSLSTRHAIREAIGQLLRDVRVSISEIPNDFAV